MFMLTCNAGALSGLRVRIRFCFGLVCSERQVAELIWCAGPLLRWTWNKNRIAFAAVVHGMARFFDPIADHVPNQSRFGDGSGQSCIDSISQNSI